MANSAFLKSSISLDSPVFTTKITSPMVVGGTGTTATLTLNGTSNVVVSGSTILLQPSGGKVGIGTTTPALNLSVQGLYGMPLTTGVQSSGIFRVQDSASNIALDIGVQQSLGTWIQSENKSNSAVLPLLLNPNGGNVGIGPRASTSRLQVSCGWITTDIGEPFAWNLDGSQKYVTTNYGAAINTEAIGGRIAFYTAPSGSTGCAASVTERLTILNTGNVGIGTSTPGVYKLMVHQGTNKNLGIASEPEGMSLEAFNDAVNASVSLSIYAVPLLLPGSTIGIGTTSPLNVSCLGASNATFIQVSACCYPQILFAATCLSANNKIWRTIGRGNVFQIQSLDDVGSTEVTGVQFTRSSGSITCVNFPNGSIYNAANSTTWNTTSDCRIKENISIIPNAISIINSINPITFDYNKDFAENKKWDENKRICNYGFSAQEFEKIFPKYVEKSSEKINGENIDDFRTLNTDPIVPILVKAMQEQQLLIEENKKQIHALCLELNYMRNYNKE